MRSDWPKHWVTTSLGYEARDIKLFERALTHRSSSSRNNERLEFLGDAVINMLVAEILFQHFPKANEGDLSRMRASLVSAEPLAHIAAKLNLGDELKLGSGELKSGGFRRESTLSDAFEAVIGAVYLDAGIDPARLILQQLFAVKIAALPDTDQLKDPKTRLQELLQSRSLPLPTYIMERVTGEPHAQHFTVKCDAADIDVCTFGEGVSRRRAEQDAAQKLLEIIELRGKHVWV
ncbi:MAG: ribonuclease III [Gammaproteobacteria bacterium]|nr:ribonuclease III [Gammaproteobacteria bacterium]